jgi:hypothetical protein
VVVDDKKPDIVHSIKSAYLDFFKRGTEIRNRSQDGASPAMPIAIMGSMTYSVAFDAASTVRKSRDRMLSFKKTKVAGVSRPLRGRKRAHLHGRRSLRRSRCAIRGRFHAALQT